VALVASVSSGEGAKEVVFIANKTGKEGKSLQKEAKKHALGSGF
jgi:hypothetical protein